MIGAAGSWAEAQGMAKSEMASNEWMEGFMVVWG